MKKIIKVSLISASVIILMSVLFFLEIKFELVGSSQTTGNVKLPDNIVTIDNYKDDAHYEEIEKTFHSKRGTMVDMYGDPIQDHIELYLDPISDTGADMEIGRLVFKIEVNGGFEFFVKELGAYTLSLQDGWYLDQPNSINPIDFREAADAYRIIVHNKEHDEEARGKYIKIIENGDTLWSIATEYYGEGYYWPLLARNNNLEQESGIPEIYAGNELFIPPLSSFNVNQLKTLREAFYAGNFESILTINNEVYKYKIDYPGRWIVEISENRVYNENLPYYNNYIHKQKIIGPEYRDSLSSNLYKKSFVSVSIYDNRDDMNFEEFIKYTDLGYLEAITTEDRGDGGILVIDGYYNETQHLLFFEDGLIYDVSFSGLFYVNKEVNPILHQEILDMINSFKIIKL